MGMKVAKPKTATVIKSLTVAIVVGGLVYSGFVLLQSDTIASSAHVGSVNVGGMTMAQARTAIEDKIVAPAEKPFSVMVAGSEYALDPASAGLTVDVAATLNQLEGNKWNPRFQFTKHFGKIQLQPVVAIDAQKLDSALVGVSLSLETAPIEPVVSFNNGSPVVTPGQAGVVINKVAAQLALRAHFARFDGPLTLSTNTVAPTVSDAQAKAYVAKYAAAIGSPLTVNIGKQSVTFDQATLYSATTLRVVSGKLEPYLDGDLLLAAVNKTLPKLGVAAQDATFKIWHGKPYVVPEKVGRGVTSQELIDSVTPVILRAEGRTARIALIDIEPELTAAQAKRLGVVEKLSSFTQHFPYAAYRVTNIGQAARYVDGTIVMPGETFSMNDTVKERTVVNGYTTGFIIGPGGQFREDLGGGVSTATTAVWTAAFYANMERIEQRAHSFWISRYRPGLEATVSFGSLDMRWRNPLKTAVLIKASITNSSVTVTLYGTKTFDEVQAISSPMRNTRPYATVYSSDPLCIAQDGVNGFDITVTRKVYKDHKVVASQDFVTNYAAGPHVICSKKPETQ
jgi:vancomycin resistance protein YoaR